MSLRVLATGTFSLLVDGGRPRSRGLGIPIGGAADRTSWMLGNALVGNPPFTSSLEITLTGPTLTAQTDVGLCVFGAPFQLWRDGDPIEDRGTFTLRAGQTLRVGGTPSGCRAYLCVPGGFRATPVLESVTGFAPVQVGDVLECDSSELLGRSLVKLPRNRAEPDAPSEGDARPDGAASPSLGASDSVPIHVLPGPQADWFDEAFFHHTYRVTPASNRMGVRLEGPPLVLPKRELVSEPVAPGAIQITNEGKAIVLGVDGQTIGGYPKIAHVISADLDTLGQLRPGDELQFQLVNEKQAEAAAAEQRDMLQKLIRKIRIATS